MLNNVHYFPTIFYIITTVYYIVIHSTTGCPQKELLLLTKALINTTILQLLYLQQHYNAFYLLPINAK